MTDTMLMIIGSIFAFLGILLWPLSFFHEPRKVRNGLYFIISYFSATIFILCLKYFGYSNEVSVTLSFLFFSAPFLLVFPFVFALVLVFFNMTIKLLKNEGVRLHNFLGALFAGLILVWMLVLPMLIDLSTKLWQTTTLSILTAYIGYFFLLFAIYFIATFTYWIYPKTWGEKKYVIVLGAGLIDGEFVTPLLANRIDRAIRFANKQVKRGYLMPLIIMSGGQGPDEKISEADAMTNYALHVGVPEEFIVKENQSKNTYENMLFSKKIVNELFDQRAKGVFSTNNFHVFRAALLARKVGLRAQGIAAPTKFYYAFNAYIREFIAVWMMHKWAQVFVFIIGVILALLLHLFIQFIDRQSAQALISQVVGNML